VNAAATAEVHPIGEPCEHIAPFAPIDVPPTGFVTDCAVDYILKGGVGAGQQGNYQFLDLPSCPDNGTGGGANAVAEYTLHGYKCCLDIGQEVFTEPGVKFGPFMSALQARWDADSDKNSGICYEDYKGNGSRVFVTPIVSTFDVNGKKIIKIVKFGAFFLKYRPSGGPSAPITGQFVNYVVPGNGGPTPPPDNKIYGIHLVQ
jgi:hypothetical protein